MEGLEQTAKLLELIRERGFKPGDKLPSERDLAALPEENKGGKGRRHTDPACAKDQGGTQPWFAPPA